MNLSYSSTIFFSISSLRLSISSLFRISSDFSLYVVKGWFNFLFTLNNFTISQVFFIYQKSNLSEMFIPLNPIDFISSYIYYIVSKSYLYLLASLSKSTIASCFLRLSPGMFFMNSLILYELNYTYHFFIYGNFSIIFLVKDWRNSYSLKFGLFFLE